MKKSEITFIRLMSLVGIMIINLLVLLLFVRENAFQNILNKMNNNIGGSLDMSIYNYYYYAGFGSLYKIIFPITILLLLVSVVAVYKKINMAGRISLAANICSLITGIYLMIARIGEGNKGLHRFVNSFYMDKADIGQIEPVQLMSRFPIAYVLVIILSLLGLAMIKSSGINRIKIYNDTERQDNAVVYIFPALAGFIILEFIRNLVISRLVTLSVDENISTVLSYINDYYIGSKIFFNWSWLILFSIAAMVAIILKSVNKMSVKQKIIIETGVFTFIVLLVSVIYGLNPPALFGYLTTDNALCDMTESAFIWYLIRYVVSCGVVFGMTALVINDKLSVGKAGVLMAVEFVAGIIIIFVAFKLKATVAAMYAGCVIADIISVIVLLIISMMKLPKKQKDN